MRKITAIPAIRLKCLDCSCYQPKEVRLCTHIACPIWTYRMGKRPKQAEIEQQKAYIQAEKEESCKKGEKA